MDQNEKLVLFGATHVCAVDGFTGKIVGLISMSIKNCKFIYENLYRQDFTLLIKYNYHVGILGR